MALLVNEIDTEHRERVHGRIHVAEAPFVGRQLSIRMHVALTEEQHELILGKIGIDEDERNRVKAQVPGRIPR